MSNLSYDILDKLIDGVVVVDAKGQIQYSNDSFFNIFDLPVARAKKAKSILELLTFEKLEASLAKILESVDAPSHYVETKFSTKYGKTGVIQIGFQILRSESKGGNRFVLFFHDVSLETRLQTKYRSELAEKDKKIHEITLLRDVATLLVGMTDEDSIIKRILEKWMTVDNCSAVLFLKSTGAEKTRRLFVIDRKTTQEGKFIDIPHSRKIESLLDNDWHQVEQEKAQKQIASVFSDYLELKWFDVLSIIPVAGKDAQLGLLILFKETIEKTPSSNENVNLIKSVVAQMAVALEGAQYFESSIVDTMTKLYNKGYFDSRFAIELSRAVREATSLTLLICDIDHFKKFNDTYGHAVGDLVLRNVAQNIKSTCRMTDIPSRYGGEEFVIILPDTNEAGAIIFAERLRKIIESSVVKYNGSNLNVTISLGLATFPKHGSTDKEIFAHADEALYESKSNGRNRWTFFSS